MVHMDIYVEIHKLKTSGYSKRRAARELKLDKRTVGKYWEMSEAEYARYMTEKGEREKIMDEYREYIESELREHREITSAVIETKLRMNNEEFAPSSRSVRLYISNLREELGLPTAAQIRQYVEVEEMPMGYQSQVDMGQGEIYDAYGKKVKIYIFCMVLSSSRQRYCSFQEKPYTAEDFVKAHGMAFKYYGGRTEEIVYDQDRVMAVSENAGDLILTEAFESYRQYAGFKIRMCRGNDPESKGKIEAVVKYVKNNYLASQTYYGMTELNSNGIKWLDRVANAKIHETTKMVPNRVFAEEREKLTAVAELSEPAQPRVAVIRPTNVVAYKQNRYELPKGTYSPGRNARIEPNEESGRLKITDAQTGELIVEHNISYGTKGKKVPLPRNAERYKETRYDDVRAKILTFFPENDLIESFLERIREIYPRYTRDQYSIIVKSQSRYSQTELNNALRYCVERELYSATYFRETLEYFRGEEVPVKKPKTILLPAKYASITAQERGIDAYNFLLNESINVHNAQSVQAGGENQ